MEKALIGTRDLIFDCEIFANLRLNLYLLLRPGPEHLVALGSLEPQPDLQQHRALGGVEAAAAAGEAAHGQPTPGAGEGGGEQPPALDTLGPGAGRGSCTSLYSTLGLVSA